MSAWTSVLKRSNELVCSKIIGNASGRVAPDSIFVIHNRHAKGQLLHGLSGVLILEAFNHPSQSLKIIAKFLRFSTSLLSVGTQQQVALSFLLIFCAPIIY